MKRYEHYCAWGPGGLSDPVGRPNGDWVLYEDAQAEIAALRKDAERYRWLKRNPQWLGWDSDFRPDEVEREIDTAMAKNGVNK